MRIRALDQSVDWSAVLARAAHGHNPPAVAAVEASRGEAREFRERELICDGCDVLDLGCGNGRQLIGLLEQNVGSYIGLDALLPSIEFCNAEIASRVDGVRFIHLDVANACYNPRGALDPGQVRLPFAGSVFDTVITGSVFTHLGTTEISAHYLDEISRVLRPGGKLFCTWFRSPPNQLSADASRTVFLEGEILRLVTRQFRIYHSRGGFGGDFHDQWCLFCEKHN